ncbi:hypothetical protein G6F31_016921 [Rhizopus arrhizus]|nr:hypothetical protein G6F31_016921 [Rhizopus arrhizus]
METLDYRFEGRTPVQFPRAAVLVGVLASGNLEILLEPAALECAMTVRIVTAAQGFGRVWEAVIGDFAQRHPLRDVRISINDAGATPAVVSLRLDQAVETLLAGADARERIAGLVDTGSFREFLGPARRMMSPHLAQLDQPAAFDDGIVVGEATLRGKRVLLAAQQGEFMGGGVGEVHGAKLTGLLRRAAATRPDGPMPA